MLTADVGVKEQKNRRMDRQVGSQTVGQWDRLKEGVDHNNTLWVKGVEGYKKKQNENNGRPI